MKNLLANIYYKARNSVYGPKVLKFIKALQPIQPQNGTLLRVGSKGDGGYIMLDKFDNIDAAYSMGISDNVQWDLAVASRGIQVYMYDHTISKLPEEHSSFHFFKTGICGVNNRAENLKDIGTLLKENKHEGCKNLLLKMDIEGYEWESFATISDEDISKFSQIVVEFHTFSRAQLRDPNSNLNRTMRIILKHMKCVHIHVNNVMGVNDIYGYQLPELLEISFVRNDLLGEYTVLNKVDTTLDIKNIFTNIEININELWSRYWN